MYLYELNPFVRYAQTDMLPESTKDVSCYDGRLFYVLQGSGSVTVNEIKYPILPDTLLMWPAGTVYHFDIESPCRLVAVNFDYTQSHRQLTEWQVPVPIAAFDPEKRLESIHFTDNDSLNHPIIRKDMSVLGTRLITLVAAYTRKDVYYQEKCAALLKEIMIDVLGQTMFVSSTVYDKMEQVISYISENYGKNIKNTDIAGVVNYHPYHLNRLILNYTGLTLHQYLMNYRLEQSRLFLSGDTISVAEIAERCGFSSPYHFTRSFKEKYGCTPTAYRRAKWSLL